MGDYTLNQGNHSSGEFLGGVSEKARDAAIKSAGDATKFYTSDKAAVVLEKKDDNGNIIEFFGYKEKGDQNPMTVTGIVLNGKDVKFNNPITVNFVQPREGESLIDGTWNNITNAPNHKDAGKVKEESVKTLDEVYQGLATAKDKAAVLVKPEITLEEAETRLNSAVPEQKSAKASSVQQP